MVLVSPVAVAVAVGDGVNTFVAKQKPAGLGL